MHYPRSRKGNNRESSDVLLKEDYIKINSPGFSVPLGRGLEFWNSFFSNQVSVNIYFFSSFCFCLFVCCCCCFSHCAVQPPNNGVHQNHCCNRRGVHYNYMYMHKDGVPKRQNHNMHCDFVCHAAHSLLVAHST